jgi:hypothetical protein
MKVRPGRRAWRNVRHPNVHLLALYVTQIRLEQVRALYRLLLGTRYLATENAYNDRDDQCRDSPDNTPIHGTLLRLVMPFAGDHGALPKTSFC